MPDSVASQVMNEVVAEVGKSAAASVRPFLGFWKCLSYLGALLATAWSLAIIFAVLIGIDMENVWQGMKWLCGFSVAFVVFSSLHALTSPDRKPTARRHRRNG